MSLAPTPNIRRTHFTPFLPAEKGNPFTTCSKHFWISHTCLKLLDVSMLLNQIVWGRGWLFKFYCLTTLSTKTNGGISMYTSQDISLWLLQIIHERQPTAYHLMRDRDILHEFNARLKFWSFTFVLFLFWYMEYIYTEAVIPFSGRIWKKLVYNVGHFCWLWWT